MSQAKRAREKPKFPNCVIYEWDFVTSKAYLCLRPTAIRELPFFLKKVKKRLNDPARYTEVFEFSYREALRYGFPKGSHHRTICGLVSNGVIDPVLKGGLKSDGKTCNRFRLSQRWRKYGTPEFEALEWKSTVPEEQIATLNVEMRWQPTSANLESLKEDSSRVALVEATNAA